MRAALGAHVPVGLQVLFPDDLAAAFALLPQTFGPDLAILVIQFGEFVVVPFVALEPRHPSPTLTRVGTPEQMWGMSLPWGLTRLAWISGAFCRKFAASPVCPRVRSPLPAVLFRLCPRVARCQSPVCLPVMLA